MRTRTLAFCATCTWGTTRARWIITRHTVGSFQTMLMSPNGLPTFASAEAKRRSHEAKPVVRSLDVVCGLCLGAHGCSCAARQCFDGPDSPRQESTGSSAG